MKYGNLILFSLVLLGGGFAQEPQPLAAEKKINDKLTQPIPFRGYYTIMTRYPTAGLTIWKHIIDCMHEDGCNVLIHWVQGGFKSKRFPETWQHNAAHENVRQDFTRELIDYAHQKQIAVLIGLSPFAYDGVNQYSRSHPELVALGPDGQPTREFGIYCWGQSLCPAKPAARQFMLDYTRELIFEFYSNADGLFIESSDYSTCHCPECGKHHFEQEFQFVRTISEELGQRRPTARIVVYPHYFSGDETKNTEGVAVGAKLPFDPRWTLFFTPHSTKINPSLISQARAAFWWDTALIFGSPTEVRAGVQLVRQHGLSGYVPTLEAYSYVPQRPEYDGATWLVQRRQVPFGFGWVATDRSPYAELPLRVSRLAFREFTQNPDLSLAEFYQIMGRSFFGDAQAAQPVADLLTLQAAFALERDWFQPSPLVEPLRLRERQQQGQLTVEQAQKYRDWLARLQKIAAQYTGQTGAAGEMGQIAQWVLDQWSGANADLLQLQKQ